MPTNFFSRLAQRLSPPDAFDSSASDATASIDPDAHTVPDATDVTTDESSLGHVENDIISDETSPESASPESASPESAAPAPSPVRSSGKLTREDEARLALENTVISSRVASGLCAFFLVTIFSVPVIQLAVRARQQVAALPVFNVGASIPSADEMKRYESELERDSVVAAGLLPSVQSLLTSLGAGNEKAFVGRDGRLIYRPDVEYLTGRGFLDAGQLQARAGQKSVDNEASEGKATRIAPDPISAIVDFQRQLARRGIALIVLPTPLKPMIEPEVLSTRYADANDASFSALQNSSYRRFLDELTRRKVTVCDPTAALLAAKRNGEPQFLRTDTHWTPQAMRLTAESVAAKIREMVELPLSRRVAFERRKVLLSGRGDIATMLKLPSNRQFPAQTVTTEPIVTPQGRPWRPALDADVLLLGDSFSNIYSRAAMGWGAHAGLAAQLSCALQRPVDAITVNAGGALASRQRLLDDWRHGRDRLAEKRVVVWQFAMRDLAIGDWRHLDLSAPVDVHEAAILASNVSSKPHSITKNLVLPVNDPALLKKFRLAVSHRAAIIEKKHSEIWRGRDGWMFYLPDVYYMTGKGFLDGKTYPQIEALADFAMQLKKRGIRLLVMPVPAKTTIYPEMLAVPNVAVPVAPRNSSFERFGVALSHRGIGFFDTTALMLALKKQAPAPLWMPTDSHWSFEGMENVAAALAERVRKTLPVLPPVAYTRHAAKVRNITDISLMLKPVAGNKQFIRVQQTVQQVVTPVGQLWQPDKNADVLLIGDSFTNIYSHGGYWGQSAGLGAQLSFYLRRPVDVLALDRGGANRSRRALQSEIARGRDRLAGKKLVIYEVASRYLMSRDWQKIPMPKGNGRRIPDTDIPKYFGTPSGGVKAAPGNTKPFQVRGIVRARSFVPAPGTTPYGDMVMTLQVSNLQTTARVPSPQIGPSRTATIYLWGMKNQALTRAASWKIGQSVALRVRPWAQVEDEYGSFDRTDLPAAQTSDGQALWADTAP